MGAGPLTTTVGQFVLRACGVALVAAGVGMFQYHAKEGWGGGVVPLFLWAALSSVAMGIVGFQSMRKVFRSTPQQMIAVMGMGIFIRVLILGVSQGSVYFLFGKEWGARALLSTTLFYLLVLGVEVVTLARDMNRGGLTSTTPSEAISSGTTNSGEGGASPLGTRAQNAQN